MKRIVRQLIACGRVLDEAGLSIGAGGNISARDGTRIWIKGRGGRLGALGAEDIACIDLSTGKPVGRTVPTSEYRMHLACFRARPDIGAVVHVHPVIATAIAKERASIGLISYEFAATMGSVAYTVPYIKAGGQALADAVGTKIRRANGLLLERHGAVTVGSDLEQATDRMRALERASAFLWIGRSGARRSRSIPPQDIRAYLQFFPS